MAMRFPPLRHALRQPLASPRATQRRWARVQDVRFLVTHDTQERVLAKYRDKLESKAREKGLRDLNELKEQYKDRIEELRKQAIVPGATGPLTPPPEQQQQQQQQRQTQTTPPPSCPTAHRHRRLLLLLLLLHHPALELAPLPPRLRASRRSIPSSPSTKSKRTREKR